MERHIYDPKLGIPASVGFHQGKLPTYLDVPVEVGWAAVEKPDPQNPIGVKGVGEPVLGSGASCHHIGHRRCAWAGTCSTARRSRRT